MLLLKTGVMTSRTNCSFYRGKSENLFWRFPIQHPMELKFDFNCSCEKRSSFLLINPFSAKIVFFLFIQSRSMSTSSRRHRHKTKRSKKKSSRHRSRSRSQSRSNHRSSRDYKRKKRSSSSKVRKHRYSDD